MVTVEYFVGHQWEGSCHLVMGTATESEHAFDPAQHPKDRVTRMGNHPPEHVPLGTSVGVHAAADMETREDLKRRIAETYEELEYARIHGHQLLYDLALSNLNLLLEQLFSLLPVTHTRGAMTVFTHFYDSANPRNIPSGVHAAYYVNGFAWPESEIKRMGAVFGISVLSESHWAEVARCIDVETGAATPGDVPGFVHHRRALGHNDPVAYVNQSNWQAVKDALHSAGVAEPHYWVATLNGHPILSHTECWAEQYADMNNAFDLSVLYGINNFRRP